MKKLLFTVSLSNLFILLLLLMPVFFADAGTPAKVLIVPGHDDGSWGTEFLGVKEADMNVKLALMLYDRLKQDKNFEVFITRDWNGYKKEFADYFQNNEEVILQFIKNSKEKFDDKIRNGEVEEFENVYHNDASDGMVLKLYGINKWADENNIGAVIHIHFNDYPRTKTHQRGKYKGFAVYIPEESLKNSKASSPLGFFVFNSLFKNYYISDYKKESGGVVPDQSLIALGANNTLNTRSVLIEYGYIYERIFSTYYKREEQMKRMAKQTYEGIKKYFDYLAQKPHKIGA